MRGEVLTTEVDLGRHLMTRLVVVAVVVVAVMMVIVVIVVESGRVESRRVDREENEFFPRPHLRDLEVSKETGLAEVERIETHSTRLLLSLLPCSS